MFRAILKQIFQFLLISLIIQSTYEAIINGELERDGVIPDVIPRTTYQIQEASIHFLPTETSQGSNVFTAKLGNELTIEQTASQPLIVLNGTTGDELINHLLTIIMTDPDAPSRKTHEFREWMHWLSVDCEISVLDGQTLSSCFDLVKYKGPGPPQGSGLHRYVLLIYVQNGSLKNVSPPEERKSFNTTKFASENQLSGPFAANYFQVQRK